MRRLLLNALLFFPQRKLLATPQTTYEEVAVETEDGGLQIPRTALRDALFATEGFEGITGTLSCNELGDCQQTATMAVFAVENGEFTEDPVFSEELNLEDVVG